MLAVAENSNIEYSEHFFGKNKFAELNVSWWRLKET